MPPTGGRRASVTMKSANCELGTNRQIWVNLNAATGFSLPNGADRSPDASWVSRERWEALDTQEKNLPLCPDFVVELRSPTDNLKKTSQNAGVH